MAEFIKLNTLKKQLKVVGKALSLNESNYFIEKFLRTAIGILCSDGVVLAVEKVRYLLIFQLVSV